MSFFSQFFGMKDENEVALVLTWRGLAELKIMLALLPLRTPIPFIVD